MKRDIKEIYNMLASEYDEKHFQQNSAAEYVEKKRLDLIYPYLQKLKSLRVLDVACGTGTYLTISEKNGAEVVGCDISKNMSQVCKNKGIDNSFIGNYHFLPFQDNTFDLVLCINAIHYSSNPEKVLSDMKRVLTDDGIILFTYFNISNFRGINYVRKMYKKDTPITYEHRFLSPKIGKIFKDVKLIPTCHSGINLLPFPVNSKPRHKKFLTFLYWVENHISRTPLMHFFNEVFVELKNK